MRKECFLVSTDLDGTLLDHHDYSWQAASTALAHLANHQIPVVINTSKTLNEVIHLQQSMSIQDPFIIENGSAVYLYENDDRFDLSDVETASVSAPADITLREYILGTPSTTILQILGAARRQFDWSFTGFNDIAEEQLVELTGLTLENATSAKNRQYSEPLIWQDSEDNLIAFKHFLVKKGLTLLKGGRFYHVLGKTNKGKAIQWLLKRRSIEQASILIALGDSNNDLDMLKVADHAVLVKSPTHTYPELCHSDMIRTDGEGPVGWNQAILQLTA